MSLPDSGRVLGVDVGWSERKRTTAACLLTWSPTTVTVEPHRLSVGAQQAGHLGRLVGDGDLLAAAFDGPLRRELDPIGVYRDAELILTRGLQQTIGKPGQSSSGNGRKLNEAANRIARAVLDTGRVAQAKHRAAIHEKALVEAFPTTFLGVMIDEGEFPSHGSRSDAYFEHLLGPELPRPNLPQSNRLAELLKLLLPGRSKQGSLVAIRDHDERAAVVCAITAVCVAARRYVAVGDKANGYISAPSSGGRWPCRAPTLGMGGYLRYPSPGKQRSDRRRARLLGFTMLIPITDRSSASSTRSVRAVEHS